MLSHSIEIPCRNPHRAAIHQNWRDDLQVNATSPDNGPNREPQQTNSSTNPDLNAPPQCSDNQSFPGNGTPQHGGAPHYNPGPIYGATSYWGAQTYDSNHCRWVKDRSSLSMPSPRPSPWDIKKPANSLCHSNATGIPDNFPLSKAFLDGVGFTAVELYDKLQCVHRVIWQSWHNKIHNTFGL